MLINLLTLLKYKSNHNFESNELEYQKEVENIWLFGFKVTGRNKDENE